MVSLGHNELTYCDQGQIMEIWISSNWSKAKFINLTLQAQNRAFKSSGINLHSVPRLNK